MEQDLLVWDVSLYSTSSQDAAKKDGIGLITEKISGEEENGQYIFDTKTIIKLQLTPSEHEYIQINSENRGEFLMVAPESLSKRRDILSQITDWRRSLDRRVMGTVRNQFFQAQVGEMFFWFSGKAEDWEEPAIRRYNGEYGYLYAARVVQDAGVRKLIVHDFKTDLPTAAYILFLQGVATEVISNHQSDEAYLDKAMTTVARVDKEKAEKIDDVHIWKLLARAKGIVTGNERIFNLPVDAIISLQDRELHQRLEQSAAAEVADWMMTQINLGVAKFRIQAQIRERFIDATKRALIGFERMGNVRDYSNGGRLYEDSMDPVILKAYSGSNGDFCGDWGSKKSIALLSTNPNVVKALMENPTLEAKRCISCGEINLCGNKCHECGGALAKVS